jgi:hypothetical protein
VIGSTTWRTRVGAAIGAVTATPVAGMTIPETQIAPITAPARRIARSIIPVSASGPGLLEGAAGAAVP